MKAIHLSYSQDGGAGIAAGRTADALRRFGWDVKLLSSTAGSACSGFRSSRMAGWRLRLDAIPNCLYPRRELFSSWSNNIVPSKIASDINRAGADIVHLHWIGGAFAALSDLARISAPLVWTLHDAWGFTGGCHYPGDCVRWSAHCGQCPQLKSSAERDLSAANRKRKLAFSASVAAFVLPSRWLAELLAASGMASREKIHVIPNGVDGAKFEVVDQLAARRRLELSANAIVLMSGSAHLDEVRKGAHLLKRAMCELSEQFKRKMILLLCGKRHAEDLKGWNCEVRYLGDLKDERSFAAFYGAADAFILPSLQDNLPNMAIEAQACGCPVIGLPSGGFPEIIEDGVTGKVARDVSVPALIEAVGGWFARVGSRREIAMDCRSRFEANFSIKLHGERLDALYKELCNSSDGNARGDFHAGIQTRKAS